MIEQAASLCKHMTHSSHKKERGGIWGGSVGNPCIIVYGNVAPLNRNRLLDSLWHEVINLWLTMSRTNLNKTADSGRALSVKINSFLGEGEEIKALKGFPQLLEKSRRSMLALNLTSQWCQTVMHQGDSWWCHAALRKSLLWMFRINLFRKVP